MSQLPSPRAAAPEMPETKDLVFVLPQKQKSKIGFPWSHPLEPIFHLRTLLILNKVIDVK